MRDPKKTKKNSSIFQEINQETSLEPTSPLPPVVPPPEKENSSEKEKPLEKQNSPQGKKSAPPPQKPKKLVITKKPFRPIERCKDVAIVLLLCLALFLANQVEAFQQLTTVLGESTQDQAIPYAQSQELSGGILPIAMVAVTQQEEVIHQYGVQYHQEEVRALYDATSNLLKEAMSGLSHPIAIPETEFLSAITQPPSLYFDLRGQVPLDLLYGWLAGTDALPFSGTANRLALSPWADGMALFYQQGNHYFACPVQNLDQPRLATALEHTVGNQAQFAFQREDLAYLHPLTLLLEEDLQPPLYLATTPFVETQGREDLLEALDFPLAYHTQYATSDGIVVRIGTDSLRLSDGGTVAYSSEHSSRYTLSVGATPTNFQLAEGCRQFAYQILQTLEVVPQLNLASYEKWEDGAKITFDYSLNGIPLLFADGISGAEFWVSGEEIHSFSLQYRHYTPTETPSPVLPPLQAQAVLQSFGIPQGELFLVYQDSGGEQISTNWVTP